MPAVLSKIALGRARARRTIGAMLATIQGIRTTKIIGILVIIGFRSGLEALVLVAAGEMQ